MSDSNHHNAADEREESPSRSDHSRSRSASRSRSRSKSRSRSGSSRHSSRSRSRSKHSRSYSKSRSRSRSHSRGKSSGSRDRKRNRSYSYSRSRSPSPYRRRSRSPLSDRKRHQGNREEPTPSRCLGVFGLSLYTTERDLRPLFEKYGPIEEINIVYDHQTGRSRGFGFVYYEYTEDAEVAKERTSGIELDGRRIRVDFSITKRAHTPTPGVYMGKASQHRDYKRRRDDYRDDNRERDDSYRSGDRYERKYRSRSRSYSPRRY